MKFNFKQMTQEGDELADQFVSKFLDIDNPEESFAQFMKVMGILRNVETNEDLKNLNYPNTMSSDIRILTEKFIKDFCELPKHFDLNQIQITENYFSRNGFLLSLVYLCASLPEVYVIPDISSLLHVTGQLESATEQRIRSTATMVLSVLLKDGIVFSKGYGIVSILRARLIHSAVRVFILRGQPDVVLANNLPVRPIKKIKSDQFFNLLYKNGWNPDPVKMPCNQEEMLYTLMTFSYVFIRSLRRLNIPMTASEERAYLSTWNVVGYYMGIRSEYLPQTFGEAEFIFHTLQEQAKHQKLSKPHKLAQEQLGIALMKPLIASSQMKLLSPFFRYLTTYLTSHQTVTALNLWKPSDRLFYRTFPTGVHLIKTIDDQIKKKNLNRQVMKKVTQKVSLLIIKNLLMNQNQPIALPKRQLDQMNSLIKSWN